jgi:hypothetical protein
MAKIFFFKPNAQGYEAIATFKANLPKNLIQNNSRFQQFHWSCRFFITFKHHPIPQALYNLCIFSTLTI